VARYEPKKPRSQPQYNWRKNAAGQWVKQLQQVVAPSKRRPTTPQIKKSQRRIAAYLVKFDGTIKDAAKNLGVTEQQLTKYLWQPVKKTRRAFNISFAYQDLYEKSLGEVRKNKAGKEFRRIVIGGVQIPKAKKRTIDYNTGEIVESWSGLSGRQEREYQVYETAIQLEQITPTLQMKLEWQKYADNKGIPTSIDEIKELYADGEINRRTVNSILSNWRKIYEVSDDWYEDTIDQFDEYDDLRD
jgi:riboflavin synthase